MIISHQIAIRSKSNKINSKLIHHKNHSPKSQQQCITIRTKDQIIPFLITMSQQPKGLVFCARDWSDTFCITKSIEFIVSFIILLFMVHDFIIRFCKQRELNFFCVAYLIMILALFGSLFIIPANCLFTLDHRIYPMLYIESYAYDVYFTTIVYQVSRRLVQLKKGSPNFKRIWFTIHALLAFFILFLTVTFIVRNVFTYYDCQQTWFLIVNLFGISLSILMVIAGRFHSKFQTQKIQGMVQKNTKNPLPEVWKWIIINIVCQFFRFVRSFIYQLSPYNCSFSASYTTNQILGLFFDVFSFHVGMVATIYFFHKKDSQDDFSSRQFESSIRDRIGSGYSKQIEMESTTGKPLPGNSVIMVRNKAETEMDPQRLTGKLFLDVEGSKGVSKGEEKLPIFSI